MNTRTLLFVDEDERHLERMRLYFGAEGYLVVTVTNAADAIMEAYSDERPDVIITEIKLPDMSGYELCKILRMNRKTWNIQIIFLAELKNLRPAVII